MKILASGVRSLLVLASSRSALTFTSTRTLCLRGGSSFSSSLAAEKKKAVTGWNHNLPEKDSEFWKGQEAKELPKNLLSAIEADQASQAQKEKKEDKPRTGWLHAKKKTPVSKAQAGEKKTDPGNKARKLLEQAMMEQKVNHRMISPPVFHPVSEGRRVAVTEHKISVPLDRYNPPKDPKDKEPMVDVYFSIVELVSTPEEEKFFLQLQATTPGLNGHQKKREMMERAKQYKSFANLQDANECMLYLQGGPGFGAPVPYNGIGLTESSSWVGAALSKGFKRIILMDQRGTGRSSTITKQTLQRKYPDLFLLDDYDQFSSQDTVDTLSNIETKIESFTEGEVGEQAEKMKNALKEATEYMSHFRADNIVHDAEAVKDALLQTIDDDDDEIKSKSIRPFGAALGQSFGGFCMMSYLSLIPHPPKICLLTGGIAPMLTNIDEVYSSLRERVKDRNMLYYERYPGDVAQVKRILKHLEKTNVTLPSGGILTPRRFLMIGISLGGSPTAFASMHSLISSAFISEDEDILSKAFLKEMDSTQPFDDHPIYYLLHESIYCDEHSDCKKSSWSAYRMYERDDSFNFQATCDYENGSPTLMTGEVIFPWMSEGDYAELSGLGMRALAHSIAEKNDWKPLYDADEMKKKLCPRTGVSKAAAAVYYDDMYVDFDACMKVCKRGNPLENCKVWISNEYQHSGLRDDGAMIFKKLLGMVKGEIGTPS